MIIPLTYNKMVNLVYRDLEVKIAHRSKVLSSRSRK